jgi:hypothetical protein
LDTDSTDLVAKGDLNVLRAEMMQEFAEINGKLALLQWMLAAVLALAIANFGKQYF